MARCIGCIGVSMLCICVYNSLPRFLSIMLSFVDLSLCANMHVVDELCVLFV